MSQSPFFMKLDMTVRQLMYGLSHDWRSMGNWIKRALVCAIVAFVHLFFYSSPAGIRLESAMLHQWFAFRGERETPKSVSIVRIDEPAYNKIKLLPGEKFPRGRVADGLNRITAAGAKLIVLDLIARHKGEDPQADQELASALANSPSVIGRLTEEVIYTDENGNKQKRKFAGNPLALFGDSAKAVVPMMVRLTDGVSEQICLSNEELVLADVNVPLLKPLRDFVSADIPEPGGFDFINFYGGPGRITSLSFAELMDESPVPEKYFKDRVVFIGAMSKSGVGVAAGKDTFITRYSSDAMYGVEIHATIAANLIDRSWLKRYPRNIEKLVLNVLAFVAAYVIVSVGVGTSVLVAFLAAVLGLGASYYSFANLFYFIPGAGLFVVVLPALVIIRWALAGYLSGKEIDILNRLRGSVKEQD